MNVQDMINFLQTIEDKTLPIFSKTNTISPININLFNLQTVQSENYEKINVTHACLDFAKLCSDIKTEEQKQEFKKLCEERDSMSEFILEKALVIDCFYLK